MAVPPREGTSSLTLTWRGHAVTVYQNAGHPSHYLWIDIEEKTFFLGSLTGAMTRGDVRKMAVAWLEAHPQHTAAH